jgi:hypothetical protein
VGRTPKALVYDQIIADLKEAKSLLSDDYSFSSNQRVRVNKGAAIALLARVYLYVEDWTNAEGESTTVINNTSLYSLEPDLTKVFRASSREAIFQFWSQQYPNDFGTFRIHPIRGPLNGALNSQFATSFETGDQRALVWIANIPFAGNTYYGVRKYQSFAIPPDDYSTVLRLSELYLIRGEARAQLNKLPAAASDINMIRNRAGLANIASVNQADLLNDVMRERQSELFTEWAHRWFDLKRTGRADLVMGAIKHDWNSEDELYPIPESQLTIDPAMTQNPN